MADVLTTALPSTKLEKPTLAMLQDRIPGVRWAGRAGRSSLASGSLGDMTVEIQGRGQPETLSLNWSKVGAEIPHDVVKTLRERGFTLVEMSCEQLGVGEGERRYAGTTPDNRMFTLTIYRREAPTASANSTYGATVSLTGGHPPKGALADCAF